MHTSPHALSYHEFMTPSDVPFLVVDHRDSRFPIREVRVTAAGVIEWLAADGRIEALGTIDEPCSQAVLVRIRTHHEGILLVQVDMSKAPEGVSEQILSARLL